MNQADLLATLQASLLPATSTRESGSPSSPWPLLAWTLAAALVGPGPAPLRASRNRNGAGGADQPRGGGVMRGVEILQRRLSGGPMAG